MPNKDGEKIMETLEGLEFELLNLKKGLDSINEKLDSSDKKAEEIFKLLAAE